MVSMMAMPLVVETYKIPPGLIKAGGLYLEVHSLLFIPSSSSKKAREEKSGDMRKIPLKELIHKLPEGSSDILKI